MASHNNLLRLQCIIDAPWKRSSDLLLLPINAFRIRRHWKRHRISFHCSLVPFYEKGFWKNEHRKHLIFSTRTAGRFENRDFKSIGVDFVRLKHFRRFTIICRILPLTTILHYNICASVMNPFRFDAPLNAGLTFAGVCSVGPRRRCGSGLEKENIFFKLSLLAISSLFLVM